MEITELKIVQSSVGFVFRITLNGIIKFYSARDFDTEKEAKEWLKSHGMKEINLVGRI